MNEKHLLPSGHNYFPQFTLFDTAHLLTLHTCSYGLMSSVAVWCVVCAVALILTSDQPEVQDDICYRKLSRAMSHYMLQNIDNKNGLIIEQYCQIWNITEFLSFDCPHHQISFVLLLLSLCL